MFDKFRGACRRYNLIRRSRDLVGEVARQENRCLANPEIRRPFLGFIHAARQRGIFLGRKVGVESGAKIRIHGAIAAALYQKLPFPHYLLAVEPDVEIAADAVDVRFGSPVCARVFGVRMTKCDMDSRNLFVL